MNSIIILGRGQSLEKLEDFSKNINTIILINSFWDTPQSVTPYYKNPIIHNFIKNKKIIIIMSPCCNIKYIDKFIKKYKVIKIYKTNFSKKIRVSKRVSICDLLPDNLIEPYINMNKLYKNVGSLGIGILYSIYNLNIKYIYIFGLDFYEKDYFIMQNHNYKLEVEKSDEIKNDWINFFEKYNNINFYLFTNAKIDNEKKNVIIS